MPQQDVDDLLTTTRLKLAEGNFVLLGMSREDGVRFMSELGDLQRSDEIFLSFRDGFEFTCLLSQSAAKELGVFLLDMSVQPGFRLLTLDRTLEWDVFGYLARVTQLLAEAKIPIGVLSSFSRDHLLIKESHLESALRVLNNAIAGTGAENVN